MELKPANLPPGFGQTRGSEHEVWLSADKLRVIKATHAGEFGRKLGPDRFATLVFMFVMMIFSALRREP